MNVSLRSICQNRWGRWLLVTVAVGAIVIAMMLITGRLTIAEIIELNKRMIEFCPFCMKAA